MSQNWNWRILVFLVQWCHHATVLLQRLNVILRLPGKSIASVILKVSWIIPVTKVCPSPCIIGEQDSVHVLNLNPLQSWLGKLKLNVFFLVQWLLEWITQKCKKLKKAKIRVPFLLWKIYLWNLCIWSSTGSIFTIAGSSLTLSNMCM